MIPETVDCDSAVTVTATGDLSHACPFKNEQDHGTVTVTWRASGQTIELHSLAEYLKTFAGERVSHEAITGRIRRDLSMIRGIADVWVTSTWTTAAFSVVVR